MSSVRKLNHNEDAKKVLKANPPHLKEKDVIFNPGRSRMFSSSTRIDDHFKERCIHDMTENEGCIHDMTENEEGDSRKKNHHFRKDSIGWLAQIGLKLNLSIPLFINALKSWL